MVADKAVVVGGCGFLGHHVSTMLTEMGITVTSVHRSPPHTGLDADIRCVSTDYRDSSTMARLLTGSDILIHLGSQSVPRTSVELGVSGVLTEVEANSRLFELAARSGVTRVVFASSGGSVYGQCTPGIAVAETHPCQPISPHGLLKAMTELALGHVALVSGQSATALRPGNVYGRGQKSQPRFGVVPTFLANLRAGRPSEIWGADAVRDYIHVTDAANAFVVAATTARDLPRAINVGTGVGHTAVEVYAILQEVTDLHEPIDILPRPLSDPQWSVLAIDRLEDSLGLTAKVDLRRGLMELVRSDG